MGQTLSEPIVEKETTHGGDERLSFGASSMQGWRIGMEDAHTTILHLPNPTSSHKKKILSFFAVFDGHGGAKTAHYCGNRVHRYLPTLPAFKSGQYEAALRDTFLYMDEELLREQTDESADASGCTAVAVLITENMRAICANAGDSRAVLSIDGQAFPLSHDHKPENPEELARIRAAGGFVEWNRVNGNLALSRAIGDFDFKKNPSLPPEQQVVTADPDIVTRELTLSDEFIVIACDGIWDCLSSQRVVEFVSVKVAEGLALGEVCEAMMMWCLAPVSNLQGFGCDNMTVIIVALYHGLTHAEWVTKIRERVARDPPESFVKSHAPGGGESSGAEDEGEHPSAPS